MLFKVPPPKKKKETVEPIISGARVKLSQKEKNKYRILMHIYGIYKNSTDEPICRHEWRHRCREQTCGLSRGKRMWDKLRE